MTFIQVLLSTFATAGACYCVHLFTKRSSLETFKRYHVLSYSIHGVWYKVYIPRKMHMRQMYTVKWGGIDVTDEVLPFAGVNEDFHTFKLTPSRLGFRDKPLVFYNEDGEEIPSPFTT